MIKTKWNTGWRFRKEGTEDAWESVQLPHDAMILEKRDPDMANGYATGYHPGGKYIYEKTFSWQKDSYHTSAIIEFEGVYMKPTVYLNGEQVGTWIYGYSDFLVPISGKLHSGENTLRVEVDNADQPNTRWYSGSGIYRDVYLHTAGDNYILPDGVRIKTIQTNPVMVQINVEAHDTDEVKMLTRIYDGDHLIGTVEGKNCTFTFDDAKLWDDECPHLYRYDTVMMRDDIVLDRTGGTFGVRSLSWSASDGFMVNGKTIKLKGGCIHHDLGALGACSNKRAEYRRIQKLKNMGFNAVRYSHNPASHTLLQVCDELGMYVFEETFDQWEMPQTEYDYSRYFDTEWRKDVDAMIRVSYNHPSVIMYGIGNEITDTGIPKGKEIARQLCDYIRERDDTRALTIAINTTLSVLAAKQYEMQNGSDKAQLAGSKEVNDLVTMLPEIKKSITPEQLHDLLSELTASLDIVGYNYADIFYDGLHELNPDQVLLSSETLPRNLPEGWKKVEGHDYLIGDFMWTCWDYLGETGVGLPVYGVDKGDFSKPYPCHTAGCGAFDFTGEPEDSAWYAGIRWGSVKQPYIGVRPVNHTGEKVFLGLWRMSDARNSWSWSGQEGKNAEIIVYSPGTSVELLQDGVSLGRQELEDCKAFYKAVYKPGELKAVAYDSEGKCIGESVLESAGEKLELSVDPEEETILADGEDLAYVRISITDDHHIREMLQDRMVKITVSGAGVLRAITNADPMNSMPFSGSECSTWYGSLQAIIQSTGETGEITITASADGFASTEARLTAVRTKCVNGDSPH